MEENLEHELVSRMVITYMFNPKVLLEHFRIKNWDDVDLVIIFIMMEDFCKNTYFPKKYSDELRLILSEIRSVEDSHIKERTKVVNDMITILNETMEVRNCDRYIDEINERGITSVPSDIDLIIEQYLKDIDCDMEIFNSHGTKDYLKNNPDTIEKYCNNIDYYKAIRYLMNKYDWLKNNQVFMNNLNEVIKYSTKWKVRRYIKKVFTTK